MDSQGITRSVDRKTVFCRSTKKPMREISNPQLACPHRKKSMAFGNDQTPIILEDRNRNNLSYLFFFLENNDNKDLRIIKSFREKTSK